MFGLHTPAARHKNLQLDTYIDEKIPNPLYGRQMLLDRVILNLLSNAIKFTHQGHVSIDAKLIDENKKNIILQLTVEDTGMGIPEDKMDTIFESFSRLTPSYQGIYKGSGLGLYTVKRYLKMLNGDIRVESQLDRGSRFIVTVPLERLEHITRTSAFAEDNEAGDYPWLLRNYRFRR